MVGASSPLLFIISEPVGSPTANEVDYRLADHGVRTWIGSLAPAGELNGAAMDALRASAATLLIFDEAAAQSRHVDRHLLVARQTGKPLIPLRLRPNDEGLLRQELLDAEWIDGAATEEAIAEISRRAFIFDRAQREQASAGGAASAAGAPISTASPAGEQPGRRPRIQVLPERPAAAPVARAPVVAAAAPAAAPAQEPRPAPVSASGRTGRGRLASPTMLLALLAFVAVIGAILFGSGMFQGDSDPADRTVAERRAPPDYSASPRMDEGMSPAAEPAAPVAAPMAPAPADGPGPVPAPVPATPVETAAAAEPREAATADAPAATPTAAAGGSSSLATVRAFYSELSRGNGASAAQFVVPAKRQSGPLSGPALSRYFSSFRRPLRVRSATPVDANTVRVAYDYVLGDGRLCQGEAMVDVVQSGEQRLVSGIRTRGPC